MTDSNPQWQAHQTAARANGIGPQGNALRTLPPLTIPDSLPGEGLAILEKAMVL